MKGIDVYQAISAELKKAEQLAVSVPEHVGMFTIKTANRTIQEAALRPDPKPLWAPLFYEGEACCLFADAGSGKSIYTVQIAANIAEKQRVLYFDFELSDKQFQRRYTDDAGNLYEFPDNLYRVEIDPYSLDGGNFEEAVIDNIEQAAIQAGAKVLIIDNLTYLCLAAEKGDAAGALMLKLMALKKQHGLSILVIAHTPKRSLYNPITMNDLAGSRKLMNFFDGAFAIGRSAKDPAIRYIKQVKVRSSSFTYDEGNVLVAAIEKVGSFLQFVNMGYATEKEHLKEPSDNDRVEECETIKRLASEGKTYRAIAAELGISLGKVQRALKK